MKAAHSTARPMKAAPSRNAWERLSQEWERTPPLTEAPAGTPSAIVFGALLDRRGSTHEGAGKNFRPELRMYTVRVVVDQFLKSAAAMYGLGNNTLRVHVIHEAPGPRLQRYRGVYLHRLQRHINYSAAELPMPAHDARWEAIQAVIDEELPHPIADSACVFSIDFLDVRILGDARSLCVSNPTALHASSDICVDSVVDHMLRWQHELTGWLPQPSTSQMDALLHDRLNISDRCRQSHTLMRRGRLPFDECEPRIGHNVGIWGGSFRSVFVPVLRAMASRTRGFYDTLSSVVPRQVVDMLTFHEVVLTYRGPLVRGWPYGPLNTPIAGQLCGAERFYCRSLALEHASRQADAAQLGGSLVRSSSGAASRGQCDDRTLLGAIQARTFFAHKLGCGHRLPC